MNKYSHNLLLKPTPASSPARCRYVAGIYANQALESIKQGQTLLSKFLVTHGDHSSSNTVDTIVFQHPDAGLTDVSDSATTVTAESDHENVGDMPQNSSPIMATSYASILSDKSDIPLLESESSVSVSVPDRNMTENVPISVGQLHEFDIGQVEELSQLQIRSILLCGQVIYSILVIFLVMRQGVLFLKRYCTFS